MKRNIAWPVIWIYVSAYLALIVGQSVYIIIYVENPLLLTEMEKARIGSVSNLAFYGSLTLTYIILFRSFWKNVMKQFRQNSTRYIALIFGGFAAMIVISILMNILYTVIGITDQSGNQALLDDMLNYGTFEKVSLVIFAVFLAPLVEELVFRMAGFNLILKIKDVKPWVVITITSFMFGLIHVLGSFDFEQIFYYAGLGVVLGIFYWKSKNIMVPIIVHMMLNAFVTYTMFM